MLHATSGSRPRTIGFGKGGITDKILHGFDSRHPVSASANPRAQPPTLQDTIFQAVGNELVRLTLVNNSELIGKILWYNDGKFCLKASNDDTTVVMSCNRVMSMSPIEVDQEVIPFLIESIRQNLLASEEKQSRLQIVRRRIRERNNRMAAAAKYNSFHT